MVAGDGTRATIKDKLTNLSSVEAGVITLLNDLSARLKTLEPNQAAIDQLASQIDTQAANLAAAITANTPVAGDGDGTANPPSQPNV